MPDPEALEQQSAAHAADVKYLFGNVHSGGA